MIREKARCKGMDYGYDVNIVRLIISDPGGWIMAMTLTLLG